MRQVSDTGGAKEAGTGERGGGSGSDPPGLRSRCRKIFAFTVRKLERLGVSGVVIEDKWLSWHWVNASFGGDR